MSTLETLLQSKLIVIARGLRPRQAVDAGHALASAGVRCLEITFDHTSADGQEQTPACLSALSSALGDKMCIGAGTVLTPQEARLAAQAGARYIISPDTNEAVISETKRLGLVSIPGAMTPTEILSAVRYGADIVKLFPAGSLGLPYFQALRAPLSHVPFLIASGVTPENLPAYIASGAAAFGVSGSILKPALLRAKDYDGIADAARLYVQLCEHAD